MTLDLVRVSSQIQEMGAELFDRRAERQDQRRRAQQAFGQLSDRWEEMANAARASDRSAAAPLDPLDTRVARGEAPRSYEVLATDGSSIEPDRHGPTICALVNIGQVRIRYGDAPSAALSSAPSLYHRTEDLYVEQNGRRLLLRERLLDARRSLMEMSTLSEMCQQSTEQGISRIALADGLLTIWRDDWATTEEGTAVVKAFSDALRRIAELSLPMAAYISSPSSHWVVDMLRSAVACGDRCLIECGRAPCALRGPVDVDLFEHLQPGERSGRFEMVGKDQVLYDESVRSHFFYLNVGREIVRVEVPAWVAVDDGALGLVHNVVLDQVERGQGYPSALARAHEQAVLSGHDRMAFQQLVAESLARSGLVTNVSEKQASKNRRAV